VTAHLMSDKIDSGAILKVNRFAINADECLATLLQKTHKELFLLCAKVIELVLAGDPQWIERLRQMSAGEFWSGKLGRMADLEALKTIPLDVDYGSLKKIIRATYIQGYPPRILLHGYSFYLKMSD